MISNLFSFSTEIYLHSVRIFIIDFSIRFIQILIDCEFISVQLHVFHSILIWESTFNWKRLVFSFFFWYKSVHWAIFFSNNWLSHFKIPIIFERKCFTQYFSVENFFRLEIMCSEMWKKNASNGMAFDWVES